MSDRYQLPAAKRGQRTTEIESAGVVLRSGDEGSGADGPGFPPVPRLEPSLSAVFGLRPAKHVGKPVSPPSPSNQFATKMQDRIHKCSSQLGAAANNIALLAGAALDTITNLCMVLATCSARISAWTTLLQRQVWLRLSSSIPEDVKKELLEGPISPQGLFGTQYQTVFEQLRSSSEALEQVRKHTRSSRADPRAARGPMQPREQSRAFQHSSLRALSNLRHAAVIGSLKRTPAPAFPEDRVLQGKVPPPTSLGQPTPKHQEGPTQKMTVCRRCVWQCVCDI